MLKKKILDLKSGKLSAELNIKIFLEKIKKENQKYSIVLHINNRALEQAIKVDEKIKTKKAGKLAGLGFLVKSNISVEGLICNCASKTLDNYKATFNATVIQRLIQEDAIVLGMTNMDEFAAGSSGETSAFGVCKNPVVISRIPGGSSSGSAAGVAADFCDFALGSDTGGSIRNPASHCGVTGFKPTYGTVSRYGLVDLSMSLDQIGPIARTPDDCEVIFNVIKGRDEHDALTREFQNNKKRGIKVGILEMPADQKIEKLVKEKTEAILRKNKWKLQKILLNHMNLGIQTYYLIAYAEFFSGTRKFDGRKYGLKIEESAGEEVVRRILGGQEITKAEFEGKYYQRALQAKKIIEKEFVNAFNKVDIIILPTVSRIPHKLGEKISVEDMYNYDALTVLANLAEIPAISVPCGYIIEGKESIPIGMQLLAAKGDDEYLLNVAQKFE